MTDEAPQVKPLRTKASDNDVDRHVFQTERRDFIDLVPDVRERVQSLRGFDECYTDIVDYIVRCTHKIWDERDVGLIYSHYTHDCTVYTPSGVTYDREEVVRETIKRIVELPDRKGMAAQVIWRGDDTAGFYTSHMVTNIGRHTEFGAYGKPTGRSFAARTIADCMILENRIYREWLVRDNMAVIVQLGIDPHVYAEGLARKKLERGEAVFDPGAGDRLLGQYPPQAKADVSIAHNDLEAQLLEWLHHIYNRRLFGKVRDIYAQGVQWHGPLMRELFGRQAVMQQTMRLVGMIPDGGLVAHHICSTPSDEGGCKLAVRWTMQGHHLGYGSLGTPTGHPLFVMGMSHFHIENGQIIEEWVVYDEMSLLTQVKMAELRVLGSS
jgi:predicted ester cyclase